MNDRPTRHPVLVLFLAFLAAAVLPPALLGSPKEDPCARAGRETVLAPSSEPGERLRVEGLVLAPDGTTPVEGAIVYAYQTDAKGRYATPPARTPRLRGFMKTDRDGRFSYDTIRPGSYPGGTNPAHVHHQVWGAGYPAQWASDLLFDDDPLVTESERRRSEALGRFSFVKPVGKHPAHGHLVKIRLRLKTTGDHLEAGTRHGIDACSYATGPPGS
jgi:protocatechuate 3,4-dioxygenase beta subunit